MDPKSAIDVINSAVPDPHLGLPEDVFLFISTITPLVNVDLLIRNEKHEVLLTWRNDRYSGPGWHFPGGIIRYKERIADRVRTVARTEIGADVELNSQPLAINEMIVPNRRERGHFIALFCECSLISPPNDRLRHVEGTPQPMEWRWFGRCPDDLIAAHEIYRKYI